MDISTPSRIGTRSRSALGLGCGIALLLVAMSAEAVPAFARQTGQNCVACHVSFPELTPYGRWFKLSGYTIGERQAVPLAMMAQVARTSTRNNDDGTGTGTAGTARDRKVARNGASVFIAGQGTTDTGGTPRAGGPTHEASNRRAGSSSRTARNRNQIGQRGGKGSARPC
mgnify:CR=1 FL=1